MADDRQLAARLESWFRKQARPLPWRVVDRRSGRRNPYRALVAEVMLQQTQVGRVLEKYGPFLRRFPTVRALAAADEQEVLAAWSGLGYYRRARLLHCAARAIVERHRGRIPDDAAALRALPGVGRYTAGAIASIVFGRAEPIVDGNVRRVLLRIEGRAVRAKRDGNDGWCWDQAGRLVKSAASPAVFNEALMELGATVCVPRGPKCVACPIAAWCASFDSREETGRAADSWPTGSHGRGAAGAKKPAGVGMEAGPSRHSDGRVLPQRGGAVSPRRPASPRTARPGQPVAPNSEHAIGGGSSAASRRQCRRPLFLSSLLIHNAEGKVLVEQRPATGLWASMWQAPSAERDDRPARRSELPAGFRVRGPRPVLCFIHTLTHRVVRFEVWAASLTASRIGRRRWVSPRDLDRFPLSSPQRRILTLKVKSVAQRQVG